MIACIGLNSTDLNAHDVDVMTEEVHSGPERSFSSIMRSVVEVRSQYGYGTGTVFEKSGETYVLTAAHVVLNFSGEQLPITVVHNEESHEASVVYSNPAEDIAILSIPEMNTRNAYKLKFRRSSIDIGERAGYCGFPNRRDLACFSGGVSFTADGVINLHAYAFGGASGSLVVDSRGRAIGILSAIEVGRFMGMPTPLESVVWVRPISRDLLNEI
tara:strand:+ start:942 stop:1586 length:645 start_codon:yes stop_codon:yes gene_type:complete